MSSEMSVATAATRFVNLVLEVVRHRQFGRTTRLADHEVQVLFDIVEAAGFRPKDVVPGVLSGDYRDQDGSRTRDTFLINAFCPYKVTDQEGKDDYFATGWLDCALRVPIPRGIMTYGELRRVLPDAIKG